MNGWIGVDLDGTLAHYDKWRGIEHIGEPIPKMKKRVQRWIDEGKDVRIFTARMGKGNDAELAANVIYAWCLKHFGIALAVTCEKDFGMIELWDDRCKQVIPNTGETIEKIDEPEDDGLIPLDQVLDDMYGDKGPVSWAAEDYFKTHYAK